mmetsp:Transcript_35507/g.54323  ORF Transcript_35507/g.54323 Transcript_35507/m.54323 type:complete len:133 (+) Transcript_35507:306-704(+)
MRFAMKMKTLRNRDFDLNKPVSLYDYYPGLTSLKIENSKKPEKRQQIVTNEIENYINFKRKLIDRRNKILKKNIEGLKKKDKKELIKQASFMDDYALMQMPSQQSEGSDKEEKTKKLINLKKEKGNDYVTYD